MRKKQLLLAAVLCLSMTALVGCGNKDNNSDNQEMTSPGVDDGAGTTDGNGVVDDVEDGVNDVIDGADDAINDVMDGADDAIDDTDGNADEQDNNNSVTSGRNDKDNTDNQ